MTTQFLNRDAEGGSTPPTFPAYMEHFHQDILDGSYSDYPFNIKRYLEEALMAGSPYADVEVYDPTEDLGRILDRVNEYEVFLQNLDATAYETHVTTAGTLADTVLDDAGISDAVDAFDAKQRSVLYNLLNTYTAGKFEARATQNSQYIVGMALLIRDHKRSVEEFEANLHLQHDRMRGPVVLQLADGLLRTDIARLEAERFAAAMISDIMTKNIVANQEYIENQTAFAEADRLWEMDCFKYGENMLHALSGISTVPQRLPRRTSALAGAMSSAGAAVSAGMAVGGIAGPGAGVATGLLMMLMGGRIGAEQGY